MIQSETSTAKISTSMEALMAFLWGIAFIVVYFGFNVLWGQIIGPRTEFLLHWEWSDMTLAMAALLYVSIVSLVFFFYGLLVYKKVSGWLLQLVTVLPLVLLGFLIWYLTFRSISGATSDLRDLAWIFFTLFAFWQVPVTEYLTYYSTNSTHLKVLGLLISFLPSVSVFVGMVSRSLLKRKQQETKLIFAAASIPSLLILCLGISAFLPNSAPFTMRTYPKVDGATAAIPFGQIAVHQLTGVNKPKAARSVIFNTTHNAYVNLIEKKADLIFVAGPSDEEVDLAKAKGVQFRLTPIGKDAFIFLAHHNNPVSNVTVAQLQGMYTGKITNWKDVGGEDNRIVAFQREKNSGSQTFMEKKVMKGLTLVDPPTERKSGGMGGLIDAVAEYHNAKNAIGYSFYYYASDMHKREEVKFLAVEGVEPNKDNIRSEKYPFTAILYAVTREDEPADSPANRMLNWVQSGEGSKVIEEGGYIPIHKQE